MQPISPARQTLRTERPLVTAVAVSSQLTAAVLSLSLSLSLFLGFNGHFQMDLG